MTDWRDFATCGELAPDFESPENDDRTKRSIWYLFFEGYESSVDTARLVDQMCMGCPVIKQCFDEGRSRNATGVHGGIYLLRGVPDKSRNSHKDSSDWDALWSLLL